MRQQFVFLIFLISYCGGTLFAQQQDVLFQVGENKVTKEEACYILGSSPKNKSDFSVEDFNNVLYFYLSIYDFRNRGEDTSIVFKRKLEIQTFNILGNIYSAENYESIINKCTISRNSFAIVKDLFVAFDPALLREIQKIKEQKDNSFEDIVNYASGFEGTSLSNRIITPFETSWALNRIACELLSGDVKENCVGPVKDMKGYHYLKLVREQPNFGRYKTQLIYIADIEGQGEDKIKNAYKELKQGKSFTQVAKKYSEIYSEQDTIPTVYFSPAINTSDIIREQLEKLQKNGQFTEPFFEASGWYIIKRLGKEIYPTQKEQKERAVLTARKVSFFIEELKEKYNAQEYPYNFLSGKDEILFLIAMKPYYTKDLIAYAKSYGYDLTTETYDRYFNHLLVEEYKKELDKKRYQRLIDDFYFMQIKNPLVTYEKKDKKVEPNEELRQLVKKYKPIIPENRYVEGNPIFNK